MKVSIIKPDGSLIMHVKIKAIGEDEVGKLVLLHEDSTERFYDPGEWSKFTADKEVRLKREA